MGRLVAAFGMVCAFGLTAGGCGKAEDSPPADGGTLPDTGSGIPDAHRPEWSGSCDPIGQDCPVGQECALQCPATQFACQPEGTGSKNAGETCNVGECKKGLICVLTAGVGRCRIWCKDHIDCGTGRSCTSMGLTCPPGTTVIGRICSP